MDKHRLLHFFSSLCFLVGPLITRTVVGVPESTTPDSPFTLGTATAATVTDYTSPLIGDNGAFPGTSATIYNLFGANNSDTVENADDILFPDPSAANWENSPPINFVDFTTPSPVSLIGVAVYLNSDNGKLDGPRSVGTFTFTADGVQLVDAAPSDENGGANTFMFANMVTASNFVATFSDNPNINNDGDGDTGVGPRVLELDGIPGPEPGCLGVLALGGLGLFVRPRRLALCR
jgi:hypothetical protein